MLLVGYLRDSVQKRGQPQNLRRVHGCLTETRLEYERSPLALLQHEDTVTKNSRQELMRPPQLVASFNRHLAGDSSLTTVTPSRNPTVLTWWHIRTALGVRLQAFFDE